jgi:signal transduction histidine kinase
VPSLRSRLRRVVVVLVVGLISQWFIADRVVVLVGEGEMATRLQHDADSLAAALAAGTEQHEAAGAARLGMVYGQPGSGHYYVVRSAHSVVASHSFGDEPPFVARAPAAGAGGSFAADVPTESVSHVPGPFGQPLLVLARRLPAGLVDGAALEVAIGEDLSALHAQLLVFRMLFLAASVAILVGAAWLQRREIRRAVQSVEQARDAILRLPAGVSPVGSGEAPDEIRPLLEEIDRLMDHVDRRLHQSRTAIGNLSHAMKTPLAGLQRLAEDRRLDVHPDLRRAMDRQIEAIRQRIDSELTRARIAGDRRSGPGFAPRDELPALVEVLTRIHRDKPLDIHWQAPEQVLPFDREDMLEIIGNLADNACKWAASRVRITIVQSDGWCITVDDDGPGCPAELMESLGKRGLRADESQPGHGLGLAIVRDAVEAAGGCLHLGVSPSLGGLEVVVRMPR